MTKFERAKKQTIKKWEADDPDSIECGFCEEYQKPRIFVWQPHACSLCPIMWANDGQFCARLDNKHNLDPSRSLTEDEAIWKALAILTYLHSLTEDGCIESEAKS